MNRAKLPTNEIIVVLDFGAQYSQLIARRIRELNVYCEIRPYSTPVSDILALAPKGIILSGGPASTYEEGAPKVASELFDAGIPVLGICYGMQLMALTLGGKVVPGEKREYGQATIRIQDSEGLLAGVGDASGSALCWMSHGDRIEEVPSGFRILATTANTPVAAMGDPARRLYGVQFHPEVVHTPKGKEILRNFVINICGCSGSWTMQSFIDRSVEEIRQQVGDKPVVCALSGGVDSAVSAALVYKAIGDQLTCIFVDHGFMRLNEADEVSQVFREHFKSRFIRVNAQERFLRKLAGVTDPEQKRKLIGNEFIRVFEEEAKKIGEIEYLVQGTLYPDVVESGPENGNVIKSHHNVGGLPENMRLKLIEPLRYLFKDEVRVLGKQLGLPDSIVWRQPFPGPGLAVRVMGEVTEEKLRIVREADWIVRDEIKKAGLERDIWQYFAILSDTKTVGVMGDGRTYAYMLGIRAVTSEDAMTADWARLPHEVLAAMSTRIMNEVHGVNRVVYDISSKPPATIEWE